MTVHMHSMRTDNTHSERLQSFRVLAVWAVIGIRPRGIRYTQIDTRRHDLLRS